MKPPLLTRVLFWTGVVLMTAPHLGFILTAASVLSAVHEFESVLKSEAGESDEMASGLRVVLNRLSGSFDWTIAGCGIGLIVGLPVFIAALRLRRIEEERDSEHKETANSGVQSLSSEVERSLP